MHIEAPDPHPGRCRNVRSCWQNDHIVTMRCLDYEGTPHVCSFPRPPVQMSRASGHVFQSTPQPKPWVKPEDGER